MRGREKDKRNQTGVITSHNAKLQSEREKKWRQTFN